MKCFKKNNHIVKKCTWFPSPGSVLHEELDDGGSAARELIVIVLSLEALQRHSSRNNQRHPRITYKSGVLVLTMRQRQYELTSENWFDRQVPPFHYFLLAVMSS